MTRRPIKRPPSYLVANEASGGRVTYRRRILWGSGWTPEPKQAERWPTLAAARAALDQLETERPRAGRRLILELTRNPDRSPALREIAADEPEARA